MITEDYVSFETAKLLKEKRFDCSSYSHYRLDNGELCRFNTNCSTNIEPNNYITAPTLQLAMKWLREMHKLCISIIPQVIDDDGDGGCLWQFIITSHLEPLSISLELYEQCKQACEAAIKYCLENLI